MNHIATQLQVTQALEKAGFWATHSPEFGDEDWESWEGYLIAFDYWSGYWIYVCDPIAQKDWVYNIGEFSPVQDPEEAISWVRQLITSALTEVPSQLTLELGVAA